MDLAVLIDNMPHKVGTVKNIKIKSKSDDIILETVVKSTIDFNIDNKELKFGCLTLNKYFDNKKKFNNSKDI